MTTKLTTFKFFAAVVLAVAVIFGGYFAVATTSAQAITTEQLVQLFISLGIIPADKAAAAEAAVSSTGSTTTGASCTTTFTQNLTVGSTGSEVLALQQFLNNNGYTVATTGAGSPGNETSYFGPATKAAVIKFQEANAADVLTPVGLSKGTGYWGASSRAKANTMCSTTGTGTGTGTGTVTGSVSVGAPAQPTATLAPKGASRVAFTNFTLTNNSSAAVTVNGVTVQRGGLANDAAFAGVVLVDNTTNTQLGNSQTFNSNHQAVIGGTFTINPGQTMNLTVAANMAASESLYSGQVANISVVGINTASTVSGSLPITGASQVINDSLTIGTASVTKSSYDVNGGISEAIGTTGIIFGGVRVTANAEDQKLYSITWNQTGSVGSTDLSNLQTVVNGTSYPVTVSADGKYYTSSFAGGVLITKGNSADIYIKGDVTGSNASGRTIEFDIYRASDIYLVGQSYGYGVTPTVSGSTGATLTAPNHGSIFTTNGTPFFQGSQFSVTGGTLSTISNATTIAPQNIAVNVPNQTLGGFTTNFTGEPVTVQSIVLTVATSSNSATQLQNVTLVDQNGSVVAGPVDEDTSTGKITFNSSVTFPTGVQTYTVKGTVASPASAGANNGTSYTLSTDLSNWGSATGQTSGAYVTLTGSVTMSTMTVQGASLSISASASPASQTIAANGSSMTIANIVLDGSNSGEDVRLNSLPITVFATSTDAAAVLASNLTSCQLWNGSTVLNSQSVGSAQWSAKSSLDYTVSPFNTGFGNEANFVFSTPLTIPKGTTITLALNCNVGSGLYNGIQFAAGIDQDYVPSPTGVTSGNSITPTITNSASGMMTVGTASMSVSNVTPVSYSQVAGGTTGVTVGSFTLQPTSGTVNLQKIGLKLNANLASTSDLMNGVAYIYQGSTQVGTVNFSGSSLSNGVYYATSTLSNGYTLSQNAQTTFTIKADTATIGLGNSGTSNHEIAIGLEDAQGTSGSSLVDSGPLTTPTSGVAIFKSYPTVAQSSLSTGGVADGKLIAFSITANSNGAVGLNQLSFTVATTSAAVTNPALYIYSDSGFSQPAGGTSNGIGGSSSITGQSSAKTTFSTPFEIPAGATYYFLLKGTVAGTGSTYSVATTLNGDSTDEAPVLSTAGALSGQNFVWSPNSTTTSATTNVDWTNGYGVSGLPGIGLSQNRTQ